jgi:hypothetical protein
MDSYKEAERSDTALIQSEDKNNDRPESEAEVVGIDGPELGNEAELRDDWEEASGEVTHVGRPQRERRPSEWPATYEMNF